MVNALLKILCVVIGLSVPLAAQSGWISASPNPCVIAQGESTCTSTITWSSSQVQSVQIWLSANGAPEVLFAAGGGGGPFTSDAPWIQGAPNSYTFSLYDYSSGSRGALLSLITVTGIAGPSGGCPIAALGGIARDQKGRQHEAAGRAWNSDSLRSRKLRS